MKTIGFIGGGRITRIILKGLSNKGFALNCVRVYDPDPNVVGKLVAQFPVIQVSSGSFQDAAGADGVFLAVHPPVLGEMLQAIQPFVRKSSLVVSLAPKFTIAKISSILSGCGNIARINPSASSYINQGLNPVCYSPQMSPDARVELKELMDLLGSFPEVEESKIEAYAMISAMGHTYFWFQIQKLKELSVSFGLDSHEAEEVLAQMMSGTVNTLFQAGLTYHEVIDLVPVKPLGPSETMITGLYDEHLPVLFGKIKP